VLNLRVITKRTCNDDPKEKEDVMDTTDTTNYLIQFSDVRKATGLLPHTLTRRIQRTGVEYFTDAHDKRQRMIDVRDLPRLTAIEPKKRRGPSLAPRPRPQVASAVGSDFAATEPKKPCGPSRA